MNLEVVVEDHVLSIDVPEAVLADAADFFAKMDRDMDGGWQMSREWVDAPTPQQRCQIAADRLYTALGRNDRTLAMLMAGYIVSRLPNVRRVVINTEGEIQDTEIIFASGTERGRD
jgi:hypothetical protein